MNDSSLSLFRDRLAFERINPCVRFWLSSLAAAVVFLAHVFTSVYLLTTRLSVGIVTDNIYEYK